MYNLRYHIASLAAVFLALAIGLVLGSVVAERGYLDRQRSGLVEGLQSDFSDLRSENDALKASLGREKRFSEQSVASLTAGSLRGQTVMLLTNAGRSDGLQSAKDAVEGAGGELVVATMAEPGLGLKKEETANTIAALLEKDVSEDITPDAVAALAAEWTTPNGQRPVTAALSQSGQLEMETLTATATVDAVALLASWDEAADPSLVSLLTALKASKARVVGAETVDKPRGVVEACDAAGISSVDHTDTSAGRLSLIWLLAGKVEGRFGSRQGADALFPPLSPAID